MKGRPLRFLALTLGAWTAGRVAVLSMSGTPLPALAGALAAPAVIAVEKRVSPASPSPSGSRPIAPSLPWMPVRPPRSKPGIAPAYVAAAMPDVQSHPGVANRPQLEIAATPGLPPPLAPTPSPRPARRWAGSVWGIARGAGNGGSVPGAQLGGSQAGLRLTYALGERRRVALSGRVSAPVEGRGREAALGFEWRPFDAPVRLLAEQRWSLDGGRGGPTLMLNGGLPPTRVGPLVAEAYAQAGAIARGRIDGFADGAARVAAPLPVGKLDLDLGVGAWGGAQPGAARVDVGPTLGVRVPVGGRRVRLTLDWRQRVAGRARPGSGPALSIGSDF